ncbi:MAG: SCO family protein [Candidatus Methylomirabilales bacterium]
MIHLQRFLPVFVALALAASAGCGAQPDGHEHRHEGGTDRSPRKAPGFALIDQNGRKFSLEDVNGKAALVTFFYTSCPTACPILMAKFQGVQKAMGDRVGRDVFLVAITVDPERDTPEALRRFGAKWGADLSGWVFLTGAPEDIAQVAKAYEVSYRKVRNGEIEHSAVIFVVDRERTIRAVHGGLMADTDGIVGDLRTVLAQRS